MTALWHIFYINLYKDCHSRAVGELNLSLHQLGYCSTSQIKIALLVELANILSVSIENNRLQDITGSLIYADGRFAQILEGAHSDVFLAYQKILRDSRHSDITMLYFTPIEHRSFSEWSMGIATKNGLTASTFAPYLHQGRFHPEKMTPADIKTLMTDVGKLGLFTNIMNQSALF